MEPHLGCGDGLGPKHQPPRRHSIHLDLDEEPNLVSGPFLLLRSVIKHILLRIEGAGDSGVIHPPN